jgi:hypothetical protein
MTSRSWRGLAAVAGLLGLLALVAFAAAGHAPAGGTSRPSASTPSVIGDYLATIALVMLPVGAFLIFWAAFLKRAYKDVPLMKTSGYPLSVAPRPFAYIVVFFIVLAIGVHWGHRNNSGGGAGTPSAGIPSNADSAKGRKPYDPHFQWLPIAILGSMVIGIGGSMFLLTLRRRREEDDPDAMRVTVAEVLEETLDDLIREPDPRKAVIVAYGRMERTLAARGFPRDEHEAPGEYLERILDVVGASGHSVRRITKLFERARFSEHDIDQAMKDDAIESLTGLRAELLVAT